MTWDLLTISAIAGAVAYGAANGVFRAVAEHRRTNDKIGTNLGPRVEDVQNRIAYVEGMLGLKGQSDDDITPVRRRKDTENG